MKPLLDTFTEADWYTLGQITGSLEVITSHSRLLRSLDFGDDDYGYCVAEVLDSIFSEDSTQVSIVIDHFDIDLWYEQKHPEKYQRVFGDTRSKMADFWIDGYLRLFISHLSTKRKAASFLKLFLAKWGVTAFIAHEDIEATREWMHEVEAGLETMDALAAIVEPGFKESDWCAQEVGFALGRSVDVIPLRAGLDPFGFFGKYQGVQIKGKVPEDVAGDLVCILLKKPRHRIKMLQSMAVAMGTLQSETKIDQLNKLDSWSVLTDVQMQKLLERVSLSELEKGLLSDLINRVGAFKAVEVNPVAPFVDDDVPF